MSKAKAMTGRERNRLRALRGFLRDHAEESLTTTRIAEGLDEIEGFWDEDLIVWAIRGKKAWIRNSVRKLMDEDRRWREGCPDEDGSDGEWCNIDRITKDGKRIQIYRQRRLLTYDERVQVLDKCIGRSKYFSDQAMWYYKKFMEESTEAERRRLRTTFQHRLPLDLSAAE
jgi:hypothetical protein